MAGGAVPPNLAPIFQAAGKANGIPPAVLAGIASVESNLGQNTGPSSAGAIGLMQFLPSTARGLGVNPNDPRSAIFGAARLLNQYGYRSNPTRAIGAYNGGPGNPQYGYARQVLSEASRLGGQLGGGGGPPGAAPQASGGSLSFTVPQTVQSFDQAGFNAAKARFIAGEAVKEAGSSANPFNATPGTSKGLNASFGDTSAPLFAKGLLSTTAPNPGDFTTISTVNHVFSLAQSALQQAAGGTPLNVHPGAAGIAGGFLPANAKYVPGRKDQGRDGQTNPGGPIVANGNGTVVNVLSDPNGFGPSYPVIKFTSGRYAGKTLYFGHTLSTVRPGQQVHSGQVISRTGTSGVGNATVPGWLEIGFAPGGVPGPFGQAAPF